MSDKLNTRIDIKIVISYLVLFPIIVIYILLCLLDYMLTLKVSGAILIMFALLHPVCGLAPLQVDIDIKIVNFPLRFRFGSSRKRSEDWLTSISFWIPRKYREAIIGDIMEDCHELRALGEGEYRICVHVLWQLAIALIMLWPAAIMYAVTRKANLEDK